MLALQVAFGVFVLSNTYSDDDTVRRRCEQTLAFYLGWQQPKSNSWMCVYIRYSCKRVRLLGGAGQVDGLLHCRQVSRAARCHSSHPRSVARDARPVVLSDCPVGSLPFPIMCVPVCERMLRIFPDVLTCRLLRYRKHHDLRLHRSQAQAQAAARTGKHCTCAPDLTLENETRTLIAQFYSWAMSRLVSHVMDRALTSGYLYLGII
jgi:hypothetical protein